jgi:broad specificity phosphatase PhoE
MKLYLVRHGESVGNEKGLVFGSTDYPLTERGRRQAEAAAEKLRNASFSVCYTSGMSRADETAAICTKGRGIPILTVPELREQYMGKFENAAPSELNKSYHKNFRAMMENWVYNNPVEGETFREMYERVGRGLKEILDKGEDALIVAHGGSLGIAAIRLLNLAPESVLNLCFDHGAVSLIEWIGGKAVMRYKNR